MKSRGTMCRWSLQRAGGPVTRGGVVGLMVVAWQFHHFYDYAIKVYGKDYNSHKNDEINSQDLSLSRGWCNCEGCGWCQGARGNIDKGFQGYTHACHVVSNNFLGRGMRAS